jgi:hypothetical protein
MANKGDLEDWVEEALRNLGGRGKIVEVAKELWEKHGSEISISGGLLYTWQYDMRWAANQLRRAKKMRSIKVSPRGIWELV